MRLATNPSNYKALAEETSISNRGYFSLRQIIVKPTLLSQRLLVNVDEIAVPWKEGGRIVSRRSYKHVNRLRRRNNDGSIKGNTCYLLLVVRYLWTQAKSSYREPVLRSFEGLVARHFTAVRHSDCSGSLRTRHSRRILGLWQVHAGPVELRGVKVCCEMRWTSCLTLKKSTQVDTIEESSRSMTKSIDLKPALIVMLFDLC